MRLFVGNLSYNADDPDLKELFEGFGFTVDSCNILFDKQTGQSRGFGFVEIADGKGEDAIEKANGYEFMGRTLNVNEARPIENRGPAGPPNRGRAARR